MLLAILFALPVFAADAPAAAEDPVVARVEGMEIHASEFAVVAAKKRPADGKALSEAERKEVLDGLVAQKLLLAEAKKSPEVLDDRKVQQAMVQSLVQRDIAADLAEPTEANLKAFYEANKAMFTTPETVRTSRILVKIQGKVDAKAAKAAAEKIRAEVAASPKTTFAAAAKKSSQDALADEGGDLGPVTKNDKRVDPAVRKTAFATKTGEVSAVFLTKEGANIVWAQARRPAAQKSYEQAEKDVAKKYRQDQVAKATAARVELLKKTAKIKVDDKALGAVVIPEKGSGKGSKAPGKGGDEDEDEDDEE